ncbi:MAG: cell wall hydrolase [Lachnospiraceae bacterium]|nr:cell wall hydrolase [Lachnospiraceae bacterium]
MKKEYGNMLVFVYLAFLSILTIEITFHKIQDTQDKIKAEQAAVIIEETKEAEEIPQAEVMEICFGDMSEEYIEQIEFVMPEAVSERRVVLEQSVEREMAYHLSDQDYQTLLRIVEAEAGCEDENGKLLVANVVLNRVNSPRFPSTVYGVVYQANQFTPAYNGRLQYVRVSEETKQVVERALFGEDISQGALYFVSSSIAGTEKSNWFYTSLTHLFDHGRHSFFK